MFYSCVQTSSYRGSEYACVEAPELIGNAATQRNKKSTCVCLRFLVAASFSEAQDCKGELWPALESPSATNLALLYHAMENSI